MIEKSIVKTLNYFPHLLAVEELYQFLLCEKSVSEMEFKTALNNLVQERKVFILGDYAGLADEGFRAQVESYLRQKKSKRVLMKKLKRKSRVLKKLHFVEMAAFCFPVGELIPDMLVILNNMGGIEEKLFRIAIKITRIKSLINQIIILEPKKMKIKEGSTDTACYLINTKTVINKNDTFEKFIYQNLWIYGHFPNYPLHKVSMDYKVSAGSF